MMEYRSILLDTRFVLGRRNGIPYSVAVEDSLAARFVAAESFLTGEWLSERLVDVNGIVLLEGRAFKEFSFALLFGWGYVSVDGIWVQYSKSSASRYRAVVKM